MSTQTLPRFDQVTRALDSLGALGSSAETHGLLSALFSIGAPVRRQAWVNSLLAQPVKGGDVMAKEHVDTLIDLYNATKASVNDDHYQFTLLLPEDDTDFETRIEALAEWCQGYITGLKLAGVDVEHPTENEAGEAVQDLLNMSCLEYNDEQSGDKDAENAYTELVEYARVAVMLLMREFTKDQPDKPAQLH